MSHPNTSEATRGLPTLNRFITDHDMNGLSVFSTQPERAVFKEINPRMDFFLAYANMTAPVMTDSADIRYYESICAGGEPPLTIPSGTILRVCNFAPGETTAMHRTTSLDFGMVVSGEVELVLDSGESRLLKVGDIAVQRGTMHAWRTVSKDSWARMIFILQDAPEIQVAGQVLTNDYGGIEVQTPAEYSRSAV